MSEIHGKAAVIYLGSATGQAAVLVGEQIDWSIDFDQALVDSTPLGVSWKQFVKGLMGWTGTFSGNFDIANTNLWSASIDSGPENFYLYPQGTSGTYYYGTAWVQLGKIAAGSTTAKASNSFKLTGNAVLSTH